MSTVSETKHIYQVAMGRVHNMAKDENRVKKTSCDLGEDKELNSEVIGSKFSSVFSNSENRDWYMTH